MFCTCSKNFTRHYIYFVNIFNVHARFNKTSLGGYKLDSTFECYILKDCHWIFQTSWNEKRRFATLTSLLNHTNVIIGGEKDSTKLYDTIISLNDKSWNKVADLPVPVSRHCSVLIKEDTIYVIGGHIGKSTFSVETLTFNFLKSNFTTIGATLNRGRQLHSCAMLNPNYIIVVGGRDARGVLKSVETLDVRTSEKWIERENLQLPIGISYAQLVPNPSGLCMQNNS
jgi:hypothetical protein